MNDPLIESAKEIEALREQLRQAIDDETQNPWKRAIIDAAVVNLSYKKEHDSDPHAAINDLLAMECGYALDPQINKRMEIALRQAKVEVLREAIHVVETYKVSVGNSASGERAAEWTMENLKEVRDELRRMADEIERSKT